MLRPATKEAMDLLLRGAISMAKIEATGLRINTTYLDQAITDTKQQIVAMEKSLRESKEYKVWAKHYGNKMQLGSRQQLGHVIFELLEHPRNPHMNDKKTGLPKNDVHSFEHLEIEFVKHYFNTERLKNALAGKLLGMKREVVDGYLHCNYPLWTASSYRSASRDINFQNFPVRDKRISKIARSAIIPRKGRVFIEADYGAQEVRVSICYNKDPKLRDCVLGGMDMHKHYCQLVYKLTDEELGDINVGVGKDIRYCNPPEAPIWMADFSFKPIGEVKVGDEVIGWVREEVKGNINKRNKKKLVKSIVTAVHRHESEIQKVFMDSGRIIRCTPDHLWADGQWPFNNQRECYTQANVGKYLAHIVDPVGPVPSDLQYEAGYLGAMMDGEGHAKNMSICQSWKKNMDVCMRLESTAKALGFTCSWQDSNDAGCKSLVLRGGISTRVKFLNWCKPTKNKDLLAGLMSRSNFGSKDRVRYIARDGYGEVIGLTTTTGNYVAWGYASKNCAKNMFVFPSFYGSYYAQMAPALWEAISKLKLKRSDGVNLYKHLASKGIKSLGDCVPEGEPVKGTFEYHIKQVSKKMWEEDFTVYDQWKRDWWNSYQHNGGVNFYTGFKQEGVFTRNQVLSYAIQGSAFHCLLWSIPEIQKEIRKYKMKTLLVGQIHDSLLADVPPSEVKNYVEIVQDVAVRRVAEHYKWIIVPLSVEYEICEGSWYNKRKLEMVT
jgi:DNA polymerase family A